MTILQNFLQELEQEAVITRKMLSRIPENQYDFKPHEKSMRLHDLAGHIAELPGWAAMAFNTTEMDFASSPYSPPVWQTNAELLELLEKSLTGAETAIKNAADEDLLPEWTLRNGDQVLMKTTKAGLVRQAISQTIHHRAQLGVYLRLLNVPIPGTYGPSADEQSF